MRGRPLRYPHDWPAGRAQEKGIDVLLAVSFVRAAILRAADVLILASRDTDLAPALELALDMDDPPIVEVCNWSGRGRLSPHGRAPVWCTYLDESDFLSCLDPRDYRAAGGATA